MKHILSFHPAATFVWMFVSAMAFGLSSYNLFYLLHENVGLVIDNGVMALNDGAFIQLLMLAGYGLVSLVTYIIFKACEKLMVEFALGKK